VRANIFNLRVSGVENNELSRYRLALFTPPASRLLKFTPVTLLLIFIRMTEYVLDATFCREVPKRRYSF